MRAVAQHRVWLGAVVWAATLLACSARAEELGTEFTYQGRLKQGGAPLTGTPDLQFSLWDAATDGTQVDTTQTLLSHPVANGLFTAPLDFGADAFDGSARWLQIVVEGDTLTPRQKLTATPYALYALAAPWSGLTGVPAIVSSLNGVTHDGDNIDLVAGAGITITPDDGTDTITIAATGAIGPYWSLIGNGGTDPDDHFIGTTDAQPLLVRVNNALALRIEPNATCPNLIGGHESNSVGAAVVGATIGGGGQTGSPNSVGGDFGTVGGGQTNSASGPGSTVSGGERNTVLGACGTVAGGYENNSTGAGSTVSGGHWNGAGGTWGTIGGGNTNVATGDYATIGGGLSNTASQPYATIGGGYDNTASDDYATVGGGTLNEATAMSATVAGGYDNEASNGSATVGGGQENVAYGVFATVPGGYQNTAWNSFTFAAGRRAKAMHYGAFVWADGTDADYASTAEHQFSVRATGGVRLHVGAAGGGLRIHPDPMCPNLIGGHEGNAVTAGAHGATLMGGGDETNPNRVTDDYGTVGGGVLNQAGDDAGTTSDAAYATVGGGDMNTASGEEATIGGGRLNHASGHGDTVAGGRLNHATGGSATIGGGYNNDATGSYATIGGGFENSAMALNSTVGGGYTNSAEAEHATVGGGSSNHAVGDNATIGGGRVNLAGGESASVGGGSENRALADYATIAGGGPSDPGDPTSTRYATVSGGEGNTASGSHATVPGGHSNTAGGNYSFAAGRRAKANHQGSFVWADSLDEAFASAADNQFLARATGGVKLWVDTDASGLRLFPVTSAVLGATVNVLGGYGGNHATAGVVGATISGGGASGLENRVTAQFGTVGGGFSNDASELSTVGGGGYNTASGDSATVSGGWVNEAIGDSATVGGGSDCRAAGQMATIGGGSGNQAGGVCATVTGGQLNWADGQYASVAGGRNNRASGDYATVAGGAANSALGNYSFAAGRQAKADHQGSFVWADNTFADFASLYENEFAVRAGNGLRVIADGSLYGALIQNTPATDGGDGLSVYANVSKGDTWGAVYAFNYGSSPAVCAVGNGGPAAYLDGPVTVTGWLTKAGGGFTIDHPLDPANKTLTHSFVESPDMKNVYDGNVVLDAKGEATVELPEWFEALNRDFRYQLTAIGGPGPNLYIAEKIKDNRFKIAGGKAGLEVSWQLTGVRHDAWANAHRVVVEQGKPAAERGTYMHPEAHGLPRPLAEK